MWKKSIILHFSIKDTNNQDYQLTQNLELDIKFELLN